MSSILDALNKLEEEKAQARRDAEGGPIDPELAARELLGETIAQPAMNLQLTPSRIAAMAVAGAIAVLGVAAIVSYLVVRGVARDNPPAPKTAAASPAIIPPPPKPEAIAPAASSENRQVVIQRPAEIGPLEVTPVESDAVESTVSDTPPPAPEPEPAAASPPPQPEVKPAAPREDPPQETAPEPVSRPAERERVAKAETPPPPPPPEQKPDIAEPDFDMPEIGSAPPLREERVFATPQRETARVEPEPPAARPWPTQPFFSHTEQSEYGFERFTVNMFAPANDRNPFNFALINRVKVFVGERVGSSSLRLAHVGETEIGLEDIETGQRYYFRNR